MYVVEYVNDCRQTNKLSEVAVLMTAIKYWVAVFIWKLKQLVFYYLRWQLHLRSRSVSLN